MEISKDLKIIILCGGVSDESEVSLRSGQNLFEILKQCGFRNSQIFSFEDKASLIEFLIQNKNEIDIVYNTLHGSFGEDGHVQGLLESFSISYTGENVLASSIAFDKLKTKEILKSKMINTSPFYSFYHLQDNFSEKQFFADLNAMNFKPPFFFKKSQSGSSRGVIKIENLKKMKEILQDKNIVDNLSEYFIEKEIVGKEITVGIGKIKKNDHFEVVLLPFLEIVPSVEFYNYEAKYTKGMTDLNIVSFDEEITNGIVSAAKRIYQIFNFSSWVRIDFILNSEETAYVLEINNQPGMTETSDIPKMLQNSNISVKEFINSQLEIGLKRSN